MSHQTIRLVGTKDPDSSSDGCHAQMDVSAATHRLGGSVRLGHPTSKMMLGGSR